MFPATPFSVATHEVPLALAVEIKRREVNPNRIFMIGDTSQHLMDEASQIGMRNFYYKDKNHKIGSQKSYIQLRSDLESILRSSSS